MLRERQKMGFAIWDEAIAAATDRTDCKRQVDALFSQRRARTMMM